MFRERVKGFFNIEGSSPNWFWHSILFPFLLTRTIWELIAYYAYGNYQPNPTYEKLFQRGYFLTRIFPLDIFARWDSKWYLSVIKTGYQASTDLKTAYSNMAFFPLYPYLVKSLGWSGLVLPDGFYILVGLILSNLCFLGSMVVLYHLIIVSLGFDESAAQRTLTLLFVYPASFFFSAFYPESLFFFLVLLSFTFALDEKWLLTGICAALAVLTRPQGVVLVPALGWLYMEKREWKLREIRASAAWLLLAPLALLLHFYELYLYSGHIFAFFDALNAWGGLQAGILQNPLQNLQGPALDVYKIDLVLSALFLTCSLYLLWKWPLKAYGLFAILMCILPLATGLLVSISREFLVVFPVFILLGEKLKRREVYIALLAVWFALQIIYFAGWVNYYWIA